MSSRPSTWIKIPLLLALGVVLVLPAAAGARGPRVSRADRGTVTMGAQVSDGNDTIQTAVPLPSSPASGTLSYDSDYDDVFSVYLLEGETFSARVEGPAGTDYDMYLYPPGTTTLPDAPYGVCVASAEADNYFPDALYDVDTGAQFVAPVEGTYYLDVFDYMSPGDVAGWYKLVWAKGPKLPELSLTLSATTVGYNGDVTFTGAVKDEAQTAMKNQVVELWAQSYPYTSQWTRKASTKSADNGTYTLKASGITRRTAYQVVVVTQGVAEYAFAESDPAIVKARVSLGAPRVLKGTKRHLRPFAVYGYLNPRHTAGAKHVRITAYYSDSGVWKTAKNYNYTGNKTQYKATLTLPNKGKWKLVASTPDDLYHAATTSGATYVTVK